MSNACGPGQQPAFPAVIYNPPGLSAISYRVGDYTSFREALLQNLPGEVELQGWRPADDGGDLALQLLEWWAYIADILTFYNERIANNSYLGTAVLPAAVQPQTGSTTAATPATASSGTPGLPDNTALIAGGVGFRSTPGIAAVGQLAVLVNAKTSISLPLGFAVQSKPGPGQQPQVFEADASTDTYYLPTDSGGAVSVDVSCPTFFVTPHATQESTENNTQNITQPVVTTNGVMPSQPPLPGPLLKGTITSIKVGDMVVVAQIAAPLANATSMAATVQLVATESDPRGRTNTRLGLTNFTLPSSFAPTTFKVTDFQVLRSIQWAAVYAFDSSKGNAPAVSGLTPATASTATASTSPGVHLASLYRDIVVGDLVVLELPTQSGLPTYVTAAVIGYQETIWYANAANPATMPQDPPIHPHNVVPLAIPHTFITLEENVLTNDQTVTRVWYGYRPVSVLLDEMPASIPRASNIANYIVQPAGTVKATAPIGATVLLEGADGLGAVATLTQPPPPPAPPSAIGLNSPDLPTSLALPLRLLFNVINVTAGKTVSNEVLGNGDATVASQSFTLQKSPLTYTKGTNPSVPNSTLQVQVDNVQWTEVPNFNGQPPDAKVFVTREDKSQNTTVTFGDGVHGARLTTGTGNVTASYRYGSGPGGPAPGTLVTVLTPVPGLGSVRNPVPMTGGAAPSTPVQVQQSAPNSVLTLGVAVAPSDYEAIAARTPLVTRARAQIGRDPTGLRAVVTVYVDGGPDAVAATQAALATATDPNRPVVVTAATDNDLQIACNVTYDPTFDPSAVQSAVIAALSDPVTGLFAPSRSGIGDLLYDSQIYAACLNVPGVLAVRGLTIWNITKLTNLTNPTAAQIASTPPLPGVVHAPGAGVFFAVAPAAVIITLEAGNG